MPPQMFSPRRAEVWFPLRRHATRPRLDGCVRIIPGLYGWARLKTGRFDRSGPRTDERPSPRNLEKAYPKSNFHVGTTIEAVARESGGRISRQSHVAFRRGRRGPCSSPASISRICSPLAGRRGRESSRCARPSAPSRWRIVRQLLVESLLLAIGGRRAGFVSRCLESRSHPRARASRESSISRHSARRDACSDSASSPPLATSRALWPLAGLCTLRATDLQLALKSGDRGSLRFARRSTFARSSHHRRGGVDPCASYRGRAWS